MAHDGPELKLDRTLIGMVHVGALPGTPRHAQSTNAIVEQTLREVTILVEAGFDAVLLENMHDVPYLRRDVGPEIIASMTRVATAVREAHPEMSLGVQILAGANRAALAVAQAASLQFVRAEGFAFASVADEGLLDEADAGPLLRYRKMIGAESIHVFADIKKKHASHAITADVSLVEEAQAGQFMGADGVIVTGRATGEPADLDDVKAVAQAVDVPVLVGSGVTPDSAAALLEHADALIVGSWLKEDGVWSNPVDAKRAKQIIKSARST